MKLFIPLAFVVFFFTSCTRYQYMTINSYSTPKNATNDFVMENDSFLVQYNFNGLDAPINILIENKLNKPIYVDWKRSALIVNDKAISYMPNTVPIHGAIGADTYNWSGFNSSTTGGFYAEATLPGQLDFIPPQTYITKVPLGLSNQPFEYFPEGTFKKVPVRLIDGTFRKVKQATFTEETSPLRFKSYLTIITGDSLNKPVFYQHTFYIAEILDTDLAPANFQFINDRPGDRFYVSATTGFGKGFGVVAGVAILAAVTAAEAKTSNGAGQ